MRRLLLGLAVGLAAIAVPTATAASPTVRLALLHVMRGCHVWATADSRPFGPQHTITVKRGTTLEIRINCPMSFDFTQLAGPKLALGNPRTYPGTLRKITFAKLGVYKLKATNVETPEQLGLETLGPTYTPVLTVRVRG